MALMNEVGEMKEDLKIPDEEWLKDVTDKAREIVEAGQKECLVTIVSAMGKEKLISAREGNNLWRTCFNLEPQIVSRTFNIAKGGVLECE